MAGDLSLYTPGQEVTATLEADGDGNVPERGDGLEITGENANHPTVSAVSDPSNFVCVLVDRPADFDDSEDYEPNEEVGEVTVRLTHYVEWLTDGDESASAGDLAVHGSDGVVAYDSGTHDATDVVGTVWMTYQKDSGTGGKVAVVRSGR